MSYAFCDLVDPRDRADRQALEPSAVLFHARPFFLLAAFGFDSIGHMGRMKRTITILIIAGVAVSALAAARSEQVSEWVSVNLFTVSTKAKQEKYLKLAQKHIADPAEFAGYLQQAEHIAEVILYLDGGQVAVAERFEEASRDAERTLSKQRPLPYDALAAARLENEKMFRYMALKYQFNQADIRKHQSIIEKHIVMAEVFMDSNPNTKAAGFLIEAKKFQAAGLNIEAYELVSKAKDAIYSQVR